MYAITFFVFLKKKKTLFTTIRFNDNKVIISMFTIFANGPVLKSMISFRKQPIIKLGKLGSDKLFFPLDQFYAKYS